MSIHFSSAVWSAKISDPVAKLVLLKLADNANDDGKCWPSIATIAAETELCERTIQSKIRYLEEAGLLVSNRGVNRADYFLKMEALRFRATQQDMHPARHAPRRRLRPTPQEIHPYPAGDAVASREPSLNRHEPSGRQSDQIRKEKKPKPEPSSDGQEFAAWFRSMLPESISIPATWKSDFARSYDEMIRIDKRTDDEISEVCQFGMTDSFWSKHFKQPAYLRKVSKTVGVQHFEQILDAARSKPEAKQRPSVNLATCKL